MNSADRDFPPLGPVSRGLLWLLLIWYRRSGWTAHGVLPMDRKFVIIGAPHTSNWDFLVFLGTVHAVGRRVRFIGKQSLFGGPLGRFMRALGGVAVDRRARQDTVSQIVEQIRAQDEFLLIIAVEGTRARTTDGRPVSTRSRSAPGFRSSAPAPIIRLSAASSARSIHPTGDYERDMAPAFAFFRSLTPRHPERAAFPGDPD